MMTLDDYQQRAKRTINPELTVEHRLLDATAGLAEEAGEALAHVRKHVMQGRALDREAFTKELGDALWCIAIAAVAIGVSRADVARANEAKLRARYPDGFAGA